MTVSCSDSAVLGALVAYHRASTRRPPHGAFPIRIHTHINLHLVVSPCPHRPRHFVYSFSEIWLPSSVSSNNRERSPTCPNSSSSASPPSSGTSCTRSVHHTRVLFFTDFLWFDFCAVDWRWLSLNSYSSHPSVNLTLLRSNSISRTSRLPLPRRPRMLTSCRSHIHARIFLSSCSVAANVKSSPCTTTRT